jgi:hypothetical protein
MNLRPFSESNRRYASEQNPPLFMKSKGASPYLREAPLIPLASQMNAVPTCHPDPFEIWPPTFPSVIFLQAFQQKIYMHLSVTVYVLHSQTHKIVCGFIALNICKEYKS